MQDPVSKEVFQIAGDVPDPQGGSSRGVSVGHDFTNAAAGHPVILARVADKEVVITADVYALPGQPMYVLIICPVCLAAGRRHGLRIVEGNKQIGYSLEAPPTWPGWNRRDMQRSVAAIQGYADPDKMPDHWGGRLSIEPFRCTWEADPLPGRDFDFSRCPWAVAIDNNVARSIQ